MLENWFHWRFLSTSCTLVSTTGLTTPKCAATWVNVWFQIVLHPGGVELEAHLVQRVVGPDQQMDPGHGRPVVALVGAEGDDGRPRVTLGSHVGP